MKKTQIYQFVTDLLDGYEIESTIFDTFLDIAQMYWEGRRPWMVLRAEDESQTVASNNTFLTAKTLPADFRKWYTRFPIALATSGGNAQQFLREVPLSTKLAHKDNNTKFYCNYGTREFFICGAPAQTLTIHQYYIRKTEKISADDNNTWELDVNDEFSPILGLSIAVYWKLGVDYDIINNKQADGNASVALQIFSNMTEWDGDLQESAIQGQDYGSDGMGWTANVGGGNLPPDVM